MGESTSGERAKPTFCIEDPEEGSLVFRPDDYDDYEYSGDGDWLTLYFGGADAPHKRTFWIRYE
jgi:hypothetical protein